MSNTGIDLPLTAFGDLRTAELTPVFQGSFEYTVDNTELHRNTVVAGGTVTQADAMAVVTTSTTTASTAKLVALPHAKYRAGFGSALRFTTLFTVGVAATEQHIGLTDAAGSTAAFKNGLTVGFVGDTFGLHRFSNDAISSVDILDWDDPLNGSGVSGMTLDPTKLNVWFIEFEYLGAGAIRLWCEDQATGDKILVHTIHYVNQNTTPSSYNPNYCFTMWADNKATTSNLIVKCASYGFFVEGKTELQEVHQPQFSSGKQQATGVTTEVALFTIANRSTYASKTNFLDIILEKLSASHDANSSNTTTEVRLVKGATIGGTPSFNNINTTDSIIEIDIAGTTITGGKELFSESLAGSNDKINDNLLPYKIILRPGEQITCGVTSSNTATFDGSLLWKELF